MTGRFYVYELSDPRDGNVFYVGKGTGNRFRNHEWEARRGKRGPKCDRIRDIWASGQVIGHRIVSRHLDETDAYIAESKRVGEIGLQNLTNMVPGGFGEARITQPFRWTERLIAKIAPKLFMAIDRAHKPGNDGRLYILGIDVTEKIASMVKNMVADVGGRDEFLRICVSCGCH